MSDFQSKVAELTKRAEFIDSKLSELHLERHLKSLDASIGDKTALRAVAACDDKIEQLLKERQTIASATERVAELIKGEQSEPDARALRARQELAGNAAAGIVVVNSLIDVALGELRKLFERRQLLVGELSRTEITSPIFDSEARQQRPSDRCMSTRGARQIRRLAPPRTLSR